MTSAPDAPEPEEAADLSRLLPAEFHLHPIKQRVLAVLAGLGAALFLRAAIRGPAGPEEPPLMLLWAAGAGFLAAAIVLWRMADDRRPLLRVSEQGLEDRLFGAIPWSDIRGYRLRGSIIHPGFGYDLKPGVRPPRNAGLFRVATMINKSSGLPQRVFRKQMVAGGTEGMLLACRAARPDLEM